MSEKKMEPNTKPMTWEVFCKTYPKYSIALDGFCKSGPRFNPRGPWLNLNHHEGVSRLETRATCAQALMVVRQGLFETFCSTGKSPQATLWRNDCDEDVCLSTFVLENPHLVKGLMNPILNRLVFMEDMLDTTAGAYGFPPELPSLGELMWVFEPYHHFRTSGQLDRREASAFESVVTDVGSRIMSYITGSASSIELDTRLETVGGGRGWSMIRATGLHAAVGAFASGIKALVTIRERPDGRFVYSLRRVSPFIPFDIPRLLRVLNKEEALYDDPWGGGDIAAGSPRVSGSRINPEEFTRIVESSR